MKTTQMRKFAEQDLKEYGTPIEKNPWMFSPRSRWNTRRICARFHRIKRITKPLNQKTERQHTMNTQTLEMIQRLNTLGFDNQEAFALRRIAMTFHRWDEAECGDGNDYCSWAIERDEETGKPFRCVYPHNGEVKRYKIADREAGAQRRLDKIMSNHQDLIAYHQGDCRGASLYIVRKSDLNGSDIHANYTRGVAVYK